MTRVFVVDDSAFVRRALTRVLAIEPAFTVVGEAATGADALARIPEADPDLVTLDVAMPGMDGLQLLPALLRWKPSLKVLMLSAHTRDGAEATVAALAAGAVDFIDKTTFNVMDLEYLRREVVDRLKLLAPPHVRGEVTMPAGGARAALPSDAELSRCELCVIGASTGGPSAVQRILQSLPARFPLPVVVVQHMPVGFTRPFAERLASLSRVRVSEAQDGARMLPGTALIAPAGQHLRVSPNLAAVLSYEPSDAKHFPSVDVTMRSAARSRPGRVLGILLTGMGEDGADGMATIRAGGGVTIAESEASCVVYGMPRAAVQRGGAGWVLPLSEIADLLARLPSAGSHEPPVATDASIQRR
ncbi:MAG TPA: chemotaxis-specific protein-glutamate methyltransferase CheB [Gemmatimonadales bacterium]|nr:chemotaxis-specific protein-glutamate methyltransferase CheB [Gemmatimonadales bacterium]